LAHLTTSAIRRPSRSVTRKSPIYLVDANQHAFADDPRERSRPRSREIRSGTVRTAVAPLALVSMARGPEGRGQGPVHRLSRHLRRRQETPDPALLGRYKVSGRRSVPAAHVGFSRTAAWDLLWKEERQLGAEPPASRSIGGASVSIRASTISSACHGRPS
jgi:hypothetical protein